MADDHHEVRHVDWHELLGFTHLFKSFKMAIHPSKLLLALMAIILIVAGGYVMDGFWALAKARTAPGEIAAFCDVTPAEFKAGLKAWEDGRAKDAKDLWVEWERQYRSLSSIRDAIPNNDTNDDFSLKDVYRKLAVERARPFTKREIPEGDLENWSKLLRDAKQVFGEMKKDGDNLLVKANKQAREAIKTSASADTRKEKLEKLDECFLATRQAMTAMEVDFKEDHDAIRGGAVFKTWLKFEADCVNSAMMSARAGNILGGMGINNNPDAGFVCFVVRGFKGVMWLVVAHWLFGLILMLFILAVWSVLGGAIFRIAAVHAARDEKISMAQALKFSVEKFASFFMAPLLPLICSAVLGAAILLFALLINIPWIGALLYSALFFMLALVGGAAIAFLLIGLVGGGPLMYPTVAVEGSDGFDAISRSYSYVFNRPWRAGLYMLVAVIYGSICYLFVHTFAFVSLKATHSAIKMGVWAGGKEMAGATDKIDAMWGGPAFDTLQGDMTLQAVGAMDSLAALVMMFWIYLVIGMVAAFLISYVCSASTMVYYLLRRQVDATDLDDVYILEDEEAELEVAAAVPAKAPAAEEGDATDA